MRRLFSIPILVFAVAANAVFAASAQESLRVVRAGVLQDFPPYYLIEQEFDRPAGFAVDLFNEVAKRAGLAVVYQPYRTWRELIDAAENDEIDVVPMLPVDTEALAAFQPTAIVHTAPVSIFVRADNQDIKSNSDLPGRRVSVVAGDIGAQLMRTYRGELSIFHPTVEDALYAVISRTSHAIVMEDDVLLQHARPLGLAALIESLEPPVHELRYAVAVDKDAANLYATLRPAVASYLTTEAYRQVRQTWIGSPELVFDWTRALIVAGIVLAVSITSLGLWRYISVMRLNRALARSIAEREAAEARFKDHAEAASDWFFELDRELRFTFLSPAFEKAVGIPPDQLIGKKRWRPADRPLTEGEQDLIDAYKSLVGERKSWRDVTFTVRMPDGESRIISTSGKALTDSQGDFDGFRGVGRDVTRRIETEKALQQAQKLETIGKLTGGIAHDFNNLLMVLTGNLEMLKRHVAESAPERSFLDISSEAVDLGTKLTQRLLAFSRRQSLAPERFDPNVLVRDLKSLIQTSIGENITLALDLKPEMGRILVDKAQLQIALLNLALNSRDAMPAGGRLTIQSDEVEVDEAFVKANPGSHEGCFAVVRVIDTGTGIDPSILRKVVEPFFTTKEPVEGTGLGLSTVYGFAKQSGGFFIIDSVVGHGTMAALFLPCLHGDAGAAAAGSDDDLDRLRSDGERVLVVEDNARVRQITVIRLEELGYRVLQAANGPDALNRLQDNPDVVLLFTDMVMPGSSGMDLAEKARAMRPDLRVLFTTGYSEEMARMADKEHCLAKPYKQKDLARKLRDVLEDHAVAEPA